MTNLAKFFLTSRILCSPLEAIYTLLIFIAAGELHLSPLQLGLLAGSKPISSLFSFYASARVAGKPQHFKKYLILIYAATALPALAFPFVDNGWFYVFAHLNFMAGQRAVFPIWNAMISHNMGFSEMSRLQAKAIIIQQSIIIFCPLIFGYWIDSDKEIWRQIFFATGCFQLLSCMLLQLLPLSTSFPQSELNSTNPKIVKDSSLTASMAPWRVSWKLLVEQTDFRHYLQLFFLGGAGLVMMQSTLPTFFKENLHLPYATIALAVSCCKGFALIASTPTWAFWVDKISLFRFNFYINIASTLFIILIMLSNFQVLWIFPAYLFYGAMQSGCELSWNMCGPFFAKEKESTLYSSINLPLVGVRGLIFPFLGQGILVLSGANTVFICAGMLCLASVGYAYILDRQLLAKPVA